MNKSWRQHPTRHQLYGHLPPITKTIQVRRTRHAGHCWGSKDELISDVLLWTPAYGQAKAGRPARTYIQQLCEDIRAGGTTWWRWGGFEYIRGHDLKKWPTFPTRWIIFPSKHYPLYVYQIWSQHMKYGQRTVKRPNNKSVPPNANFSWEFCKLNSRQKLKILKCL